ncbi:MAG: AMP phosphorylase [Candidatus Methanoplasma sp.]|jgi:AMP phosphorylase|nr:AMP phosphorylase [Candidatus Methanoplasma sp.]
MNIKVRFLDIGTEPVVLICEEDAMKIGGKDNDRVRIDGKKPAIALLNVSDFVCSGEAIISSNLKDIVKASDGDELNIVYTSSPESVRSIRKKMDNEKLSKEEINSIVVDILENRLSKIEVSAWLTALYINGMDIDEIADFTVSMVETGDRVEFTRSPVYDFHSMGGVPGNKITPIVVSIVAAAGLMLPKTSSRAISSACGTSDFVETFCDVEMDTEKLRRISEEVGGVLAWGGAMNLAPVDDLVIKVEHPLGINPRAQMLASILSKKLAIGATHLVVDIPMGSGTKVPTIDVAKAYARDFMDLGEKLDIHVECAITYADQPVGSAIGPKLEARECIRILEGEKHPSSVIEKACDIAGMVLEMGGMNNGGEKAREILESGAAMKKFREIVAAQGGNYDIRSDDLVPGEFVAEVTSVKSGYVHTISNKDLVSIAKAAGAPSDKGAGILLFKKKGQRVEKGDVLFEIYGDNKAKTDRAKELAAKYKPYDIEGMLLKKIAAPRTR